ncbi:glycerol kinase-like [Trifolium pratense]|uniref:glycerol kinase-like n=1 Tax=Trifolium pratense TaxID=57577 RepID=UPI001E693DF7|nr:glycerol kinase-like [Trifolium pratense]
MSKEEDVFIGAIDQGTSSSRFIIYDKSAKPIGSNQVEFTQFYPQAGWVEHDPMEILESVKVCITKVIDKATFDGFNVDEGLKAIWSHQSKRNHSCLEQIHWCSSSPCSCLDGCSRLKKELFGGTTHIVESCGLPISTYLSALKLLWLMENVDAVKEAIKKKDALFGTIDTWSIWNLTGGVKGGLLNIGTPTFGAAYVAGLTVGVWKEDYVFDAKDKLKNANDFRPLTDEDSRKKKKADSWFKVGNKSFDLADLSL